MHAILLPKSTNQAINSSMNVLQGNIMKTTFACMETRSSTRKQLYKNNHSSTKNRQKSAISRSVSQNKSIAQKINPS